MKSSISPTLGIPEEVIMELIFLSLHSFCCIVWIYSWKAKLHEFYIVQVQTVMSEVNINKGDI